MRLTLILERWENIASLPLSLSLPVLCSQIHRQCSLREAQLTVTDLGLGYLSDETISFRYCSGSCRQKRRNYDLIMKKWRGEGVSRRDRAPCCRPIEYEGDIVVLDINNKYKTLHEYSAQKCGCV
uniref:Neurturin n=1 Tax=Myripristis murdjan TaxID=586833 RepID=A0A667WDQ4_9TELE